MTFSVETGLGTDPTANSYASVAEFRAYWLDRGFDTAPFLDAAVQVALVKATDYLEERFLHYWIGYQLLPGTQPLGWPRQCVYLDCVLLPALPTQIKRAVNEYAKRALTAELMPDPTDTDATGMVLKNSTVKVGPIEKTVGYLGVNARITKAYPSADAWLKGLKADYCGDAIR